MIPLSIMPRETYGVRLKRKPLVPRVPKAEKPASTRQSYDQKEQPEQIYRLSKDGIDITV